MGNHRNSRLDGRLSAVKCYPGLRPNSTISKQGPSARLYGSKQGGRTSMINSSFNKDNSSFSVSKEYSGSAVSLRGNSNSKDFHVAYHGEGASAGKQSLWSPKAVVGPSSCVDKTESQQDLLTGSLYETNEVPYHSILLKIQIWSILKNLVQAHMELSTMENGKVADFWKEAHILGQLHHPNIVAFYGVVTDGPLNNLATVTEYMVNGSLKQVLRRKDRTIDRRKRIILAMDAVFGMEYLHEKNIVHFDLKSHNFLVNMKDPQRPVCKIGDLGLSKIKQRPLSLVEYEEPYLGWHQNFCTVDVYSFGIVMWELLTGEEPYANLNSEEIIAGKIKGTLVPEIPSWCDPAWRSLMRDAGHLILSLGQPSQRLLRSYEQCQQA
ncbi:hypothetical protein GH714_016257 [Hevea brasiliensis]|uniref:Protein kinase domain-containing protein n=1 Tax=Hevea brasiliensis TaxID=3981 RepID=A0A6A6MBN5_HEVBR|nr:hypothetical protein GH714_016257 [Hevea brasiliensis]